MTQTVGIIDYGVGNLRSVISAFETVEARAVVLTDPSELSAYDILVLPGVGAFRAAMDQLVDRGFQAPLNHAVASGETSLLGICVGMQLLASHGEEGGAAPGLGYIPGAVRRFATPKLATGGLKIPHVGFNEARLTGSSDLFDGLGEAADFYFTHSYRMVCDDPDHMVACCMHGETFATVIRRGNVVGAQFHPEKSQTNGLRFLKNFLAIAQCPRNV
tara:strand:- start:23712 stop:24362 length:651 start_codon:yes stop_codon:yes gene_type:complete